MSDKASGYIRELRVCPNGEKINANEKYAALILADNHQGRADRRTYPSVRSMAEDALVSERTFQRMLAELERKLVIRREYPDGRGRGKLTYYYFPELDDRVQPVVEKGREVCQIDTLFLPKGCQKGDRRVTKTGSPIWSNKSNRSNERLFPQPPQGGGDGAVNPPALLDLGGHVGGAVKNPALERAIDQVMQGCGFARRRVRTLLGRVIRGELDRGEEAPTVALAMIAAWKEQEASGELLEIVYGVEKFFGDGYWRKRESWRWKRRELAEMARARVGMY